MDSLSSMILRRVFRRTSLNCKTKWSSLLQTITVIFFTLLILKVKLSKSTCRKNQMLNNRRKVRLFLRFLVKSAAWKSIPTAEGIDFLLQLRQVTFIAMILYKTRWYKKWCGIRTQSMPWSTWVNTSALFLPAMTLIWGSSVQMICRRPWLIRWFHLHSAILLYYRCVDLSKCS